MLTLIKFPNSVLTSKATDWQFNTKQSYEDAAQVEAEMLELMKASNGIGLAANQVGLLTRVFTIQLKDQTALAMFNPRIISASEELFEAEEGCLSFPDLWIPVKRPIKVEAGYVDKTGKDCIITLTGIDARCFLHELDHLDGICFIEKVSSLKLAMARKKQQKRKNNG